MITLAGRQLIRETLQQHVADKSGVVSKEAFDAIQQRCGLEGFPRIQPALQMLDALKCKRYLFYQHLLEQLIRQTEEVSQSLQENDLLMLLRETIKFIGIQELKSVPISIINRLKTIPPKVLTLLHEKKVLQDMPLRIQQAAWKSNTSLFEQHIHHSFQSLSENEIVRSMGRDIGKEERLLSEFANYCANHSSENPLCGGILRKVLLHLQESNCRVPSLGKLHDLASHLDRCYSRKVTDTEVENGCIKAILAILHAESVQREKQSSSSLPPAAAPPTITASAVVKLQPRDYEEAWSFLSSLDKDGIFAAPVRLLYYMLRLNLVQVTDAIAPGYSARIKSPMDLSTIKSKLAGYKNLTAMDADVRLMFRNCKDFNGPGVLAKVRRESLSRHRNNVIYFP